MKPVIYISGAEPIIREFYRMSERSQDFRPVFGTVMDYLIHWTHEQFETEGRSGSGGWAKLADSTLESKIGRGLDERILHATLRLEKALTYHGRPAGSVRRIGRLTLKYGSTVPYEQVHYTGRGNMPPRPPVELTIVQRRKINKLLSKWVKDGIVRS